MNGLRYRVLGVDYRFVITVWLSMLAPGVCLAADIVSHKAVYELSLASRKSASEISDVGGRMVFEWGQTCDAWTIDQDIHLEIVLDTLESQAISSVLDNRYIMWESKDATTYRFRVRDTVNDVPDETYKGKATRTLVAGEHSYVIFEKEGEKDKNFQLPSNVDFPIQHTINLIDRAIAGEVVYSTPFFDGSEISGPFEVNTIIGKEKKIESDLESDLLKVRGWPMRLAYYPYKWPHSTPEYEIGMTLLENGVVESLLINYDDFSVKGTLVELSKLEQEACP